MSLFFQCKHPVHYQEYRNCKQLGHSDTNNPTVSASSSASTFFQPSTPAKYKSSDSRQQRISHALTDLVAGNLLPFSFVASEEFESFMPIVEPRYVIPTRKTVSTTMISTRKQSIEEKHCDIVTPLTTSTE